MLSFTAIRAAQTYLLGQVHYTPMLELPLTSARLGVRVMAKAESLQHTGSFKARGALNRLRTLTPDEKQRGLITASAGNHALALAWAAHQVGVACTVVMPQTAALQRVQDVQAHGAEVVTEPTMPLVFHTMERLRVERGLTLVHPFDDDAVMAGQGTVGLEIAAQVPEVTHVVVGVGGGGLIGGVALALKYELTHAKVWGVEPEGAAGMSRSWEAGSAQHLEQVQTVADGLGAPYTSERTYALARRYVDGLVTLTDDEILEGWRWLIRDSRLLVEPAGAAALAAVLCGKISIQPSDVLVVLVSGSNVDLARLKTLL